MRTHPTFKSVLSHAPVSYTSHSRTPLSLLPDALCFPSGLERTDRTRRYRGARQQRRRAPLARTRRRPLAGRAAAGRGAHSAARGVRACVRRRRRLVFGVDHWSVTAPRDVRTRAFAPPAVLQLARHAQAQAHAQV